MLEFGRENSETDGWGPPVGTRWHACVDNMLSWTRVPLVNDSSVYYFSPFLFISSPFLSGHLAEQVVSAGHGHHRRSH